MPCPCWFGESADEGECTGIVGWQIDNGEISGIDVTGLAIVSISQHTGGRDAPIHGRVALLIDATASDEQERAVTAAFTGPLGGPIGELARMRSFNGDRNQCPGSEYDERPIRLRAS